MKIGTRFQIAPIKSYPTSSESQNWLVPINIGYLIVIPYCYRLGSNIVHLVCQADIHTHKALIPPYPLFCSRTI